MSVRVRFAPSPTGFLHIGGVRTALFNWLYARRFGGQFLLRIEDTDLERSEDRYTQDILASMKWLGLQWDEEIIYQSQRMDLYRLRAEELIAAGKAYRCYSTEAEIELQREAAIAAGKKPMYARTWRDRDPSEAPVGSPFVIRAKLPLEGAVEFDDLIRGHISFQNTELDDFVLIRSSGAPTYNFSCVIDDVEQRMTHIIRGDDHINNTPKQVHLYRMFNYPQPKFAHLPMILGADKKKLSKRHGAVSANQYREDGYLPETMLNFLARIGWSHGDQEIFTVDELVQFFDFDHVQLASGVFNTEKLLWLSGENLRRTDPARLAQILAGDFTAEFAAPARVDWVTGVLGTRLMALIAQKVKTLKEAVEYMKPLVVPGTVEVDPSGLKWVKDASLKEKSQAAITEILPALEAIAQSKDVSGSGDKSLEDAGVGHADLEPLVKGIGEKHGVKLGDLMQPLRLTLSGRMVSVSVFDLMTTLPFSMVRARIQQALSL